MVPRRSSILCVDDEKIPLQLRARVLEKAGFEVTSATSGAQALDILQGRSFDLVLSDQLMPGMTGTHLARIIKQTYEGLPVVLVSGVNEMPEGAEFADLFISKLDGPIALCEKVSRVLMEQELTPGQINAELNAFLRNVQGESEGD
jgi:CheY-like chemotaxis protein